MSNNFNNVLNGSDGIDYVAIASKTSTSRMIFSASGLDGLGDGPLIAGQTFIANMAPTPLPNTDEGVFLYEPTISIIS